MRFKILIPIIITLIIPMFIQAQFPGVDFVKKIIRGKVKAEYVFTSARGEVGKMPKNSKTTFTTAEPVYAAIKYETTIEDLNYKMNQYGLNVPTELYAGDKKLGEAVTFFTALEYTDMAKEKIIPLEIIPAENTLQYNPKYVKLLENIAELEPGIITVKVKGSYAKTEEDVTFTLDASNIIKDKDRLLRIAERIRNNKNDIEKIVQQRDSKLWGLPEPATRNPKIENEIRTTLKNQGVNVMNVVLRYTDWVVHKNSNTGIPTMKVMSIAYTFKKNGECWIDYNDVFCNYLGGGKYTGIKFENLMKSHLIDCEKLK